MKAFDTNDPEAIAAQQDEALASAEENVHDTIDEAKGGVYTFEELESAEALCRTNAHSALDFRGIWSQEREDQMVARLLPAASWAWDRAIEATLNGGWTRVGGDDTVYRTERQGRTFRAVCLARSTHHKGLRTEEWVLEERTAPDTWETIHYGPSLENLEAAVAALLSNDPGPGSPPAPGVDDLPVASLGTEGVAELDALQRGEDPREGEPPATPNPAPLAHEIRTGTAKRTRVRRDKRGRFAADPTQSPEAIAAAKALNKELGR